MSIQPFLAIQHPTLLLSVAPHAETIRFCGDLFRFCDSALLEGHPAPIYRRPDQLSQEQIRDYLLHLIETRKFAKSAFKIHLSPLKFLYRRPPHQPEICLMDQSGRLKHLPKRLMGQFLCRKDAQFLIHQGQEFVRSFRVSTTYRFYLRVRDDMIDRARKASIRAANADLARIWHAPPLVSDI